jgi:hypothetical protein
VDLLDARLVGISSPPGIRKDLGPSNTFMIVATKIYKKSGSTLKLRRSTLEYGLTPIQKKAWTKFIRCFRRCRELGIYIWDDYGSLAAVDGHVVKCIAPDADLIELLDHDQVSREDSKLSANADDPLFISFKEVKCSQ